MANFISISDIDTSIDAEPRILDLLLGEQLGFKRPRDIRAKISTNLPELQSYGSLAPICRKSRGQHFTEFHLNEPQALLICMFSNTARAAEVRRQIIAVFMEYRQSQSMVQVKAHQRRTSTSMDEALRLKANIDRLEEMLGHREMVDRIPTVCAMLADVRKRHAEAHQQIDVTMTAIENIVRDMLGYELVAVSQSEKPKNPARRQLAASNDNAPLLR